MGSEHYLPSRTIFDIYAANKSRKSRFDSLGRRRHGRRFAGAARERDDDNC
jgi:hypothetical protein